LPIYGVFMPFIKHDGDDFYQFAKIYGKIIHIHSYHGACQMEKDEPQPQVVVAFGLSTTKREPSSPSM
jgi:hypothetical protein